MNALVDSLRKLLGREKVEQVELQNSPRIDSHLHGEKLV